MRWAAMVCMAVWVGHIESEALRAEGSPVLAAHSASSMEPGRGGALL